MPDPNERKIGFENLPNVYFKNIRIRNTNTDTQEITVSSAFMSLGKLFLF